MKKGLLYLGMMVVTMGFVTTNAMAQDVLTAGEAVPYNLPEMKLLAVAGIPTGIAFELPASGAAIANVTRTGSSLNYTSIIANTVLNKITVNVTGTVPDGITLTVAAAAPTGGDGTRGTQGSAVPLTDALDHDLITGIGSCYTGTGDSNGAALTYTWSVNPTGYASLRSNTTATIAINYTIGATGL